MSKIKHGSLVMTCLFILIVAVIIFLITSLASVYIERKENALPTIESNTSFMESGLIKFNDYELYIERYMFTKVI